MLLLCTPNSLYSRIIRMMALELGVELPIEYVGVRDRADRLLKYNPTGKVPTLVLDDGHILAESRPIGELLEKLSGKKILAAVADSEDRQIESLVTGFVDGVAVWVREARRAPDDQSAEILKLEKDRARRCLAIFEEISWQSRQVDYALISLIAALELMTMRVDSNWQNDFPKLSIWYRLVIEKEAFASTRPSQF